MATQGKTRPVAAVILLILVTLGIYGIVWGWKVTRELDSFARPAKASHAHYRKGVWLLLGALATLAVGAALIAATIGFADLNADPETAVEGQIGAMVVAGLLMVAGAGLLVAALVFHLVAMFRFTGTLEAEGRLHTPTEAANATLLFVLFLLGALESHGASILGIIAAAFSQNALNKLWRPTLALPTRHGTTPRPG